MTQYVPADLTEEETGDELGDILTALFRAVRSGQAGTGVPGDAEKGYTYAKFSEAGVYLGLYTANGDGTEQPSVASHVLKGITDLETARTALGFGPRVSFDAAALTIRRSSGVSSVARLSTGQFRVTLAAAQPDATYDVVAYNMVAATTPFALFANVGNKTTAGFDVFTGAHQGNSTFFADHPFRAEVCR